MVPACMWTVVATVKLALIPMAAAHTRDDCEIHRVASEEVVATRVANDASETPSPAPCIVTLIEPVFPVFDLVVAETMCPYESISVWLPAASPAVTVVVLVLASPTA